MVRLLRRSHRTSGMLVRPAPPLFFKAMACMCLHTGGELGRLHPATGRSSDVARPSRQPRQMLLKRRGLQRRTGGVIPHHVLRGAKRWVRSHCCADDSRASAPSGPALERFQATLESTAGVRQATGTGASPPLGTLPADRRRPSDVVGIQSVADGLQIRESCMEIRVVLSPKTPSAVASDVSSG